MNNSNQRNMEAIFPMGHLRICLVTSSELPVLSRCKRLDITGKIQGHPIQNTASMLH